jgi:hypothetical protein
MAALGSPQWRTPFSPLVAIGSPRGSGKRHHPLPAVAMRAGSCPCRRVGDDERSASRSGDDWDNWRERIFRPAAIAVGLPDDTIPRDLRGSFASLLILEGLNVLEVAPELGHKPSTCLDIYGRLSCATASVYAPTPLAPASEDQEEPDPPANTAPALRQRLRSSASARAARSISPFQALIAKSA